MNANLANILNPHLAYIENDENLMQVFPVFVVLMFFTMCIFIILILTIPGRILVWFWNIFFPSRLTDTDLSTISDTIARLSFLIFGLIFIWVMSDTYIYTRGSRMVYVAGLLLMLSMSIIIFTYTFIDKDFKSFMEKLNVVVFGICFFVVILMTR